MYVLGARSSSGKRAGPTIYELNEQGKGRSAREIPRLVAAGVGIHRMALSAAAAGTAALVLLGQRLAFASQSAGMLQESAMFINDFLAFAKLAPPSVAGREALLGPAFIDGTDLSMGQWQREYQFGGAADWFRLHFRCQCGS
jgi:hypothetical protein